MSVDHHRRDLSVDQQRALKTAASNLEREFDGTFGTETIEGFLHSSYDEFAGRAVVVNHLPLLAERFARQRLRALAKVEGQHDIGVPVVLFLCTHNAGRSQMALGFFNHLAGDRAIAWSGGSDPASTINPSAVAVVRERGIDISAEYPKPWTDEIVRAAEIVVTMGCGDACPVFPGRRYEDWVLEDPAGLDVAIVRPIRDEIERRVRRCSPTSRCPPVLEASSLSPPAASQGPAAHRRDRGHRAAGRGGCHRSGIAAEQLSSGVPGYSCCGFGHPGRGPARADCLERRCW
jgi:arsenate reductase (thioredoxin)